MISTKLKHGLPLLWLSLSLAYSSPLWADGEVVTNGGTKEFYISLSSEEMLNNVPGGQTRPDQFRWDLGTELGTYKATVYCDRLIRDEMHYYTTTTRLPPSDYGDGFLKLNDYLDIKVGVRIGGKRNRDFIIPFRDQDNNSVEIGPNYECRPPASGGRGQKVMNYSTGSQGHVIFRVRKPIINGVNVQSREIVEVFGYYGARGSIGPEPMARITIESVILAVPDKCIINSGELINVEFGTLPDDQLDGNRFKQPLTLNFQCEGGNFTPGNDVKINMAVSGNPTSFSPTLLKTDRDNLGIAIKDNNQVVEINKFYPVHSSSNIGQWNLNVAPVSRSGTTAPEGEFNASATIVAQFD